MLKSNFGQIFLDFWLVSTGFPQYMHQLMWFQRVSSVDVGGRCLYGAFPMHALAGCKLLSGCVKCCGTSSVKWRCLLTSAVLALFSSWSAALPCLFESLDFSWTSWSAVLPWRFGTATSYSSSISGQIFFDGSGSRPRMLQRRFLKVGHGPGTAKGSLMIKNPI